MKDRGGCGRKGERGMSWRGGWQRGGGDRITKEGVVLSEWRVSSGRTEDVVEVGRIA